MDNQPAPEQPQPVVQKLSTEQPQKVVQQIYGYTADMMRKGYSRVQIVKELESRGLTRNDTHTVFERLSMVRNEAQTKANRSAAAQTMMMGAVICIIGLVVTIATYSAASKGGGTYIVAFGAILGGGYRFFKGMSEM